jgi:hypothetical protein
MPTFQTDNFTNSQSVDANVKQDDPKRVNEFVSNCVADSETYRNAYSVLSESKSWVQDAGKYEELYLGKLYSKREKLPYECKEDIYRDMVDFNTMLLTQFEVKDYVQKISEEPTSLDADVMSRIINYCFDELNDGKEKEEELICYSGMMGVGVYHFNPIEQDGYVWPGHEVVDPRQFGISPNARNPKDAAFCYWKRPVPTYELKQKYPKFKESIKPDIDVSDYGSSKGGSPYNSDGSVLINNLGSAASIAMNKVVSMFSGREQNLQTVLTEFYYRDPELIDLTSPEDIANWIKQNPGFGSEFFITAAQKSYEKKLSDSEGKISVKRYPFGRKIMKIKDIILQDTANPFPFIPFCLGKCYTRPKTAWSKGVIESMREPAQNIQLMTAGLAANLDYRLRPAFYCQAPNGLNVKIKKVPTEPNSLEVFPGPIQPIPSGQILPQDVQAAIAYRQKKMETTTGLDSILAGANPSGNYSGVQTNQLMEAALGKTAPRLRNLNRCRKDLGGMYLWFLQNYCTDERIIEFESADEQMLKIQMNMLQMQNGQPTLANDVTKGKYQYYLDVNVTQPASPSQAFQQVQAIAKVFAPFAPIEAARIQLEKAPITGKWEYISRFEKAIKDQQEQQMAQSQMQMQIQQMNMAMMQNKNNRELDIKEIMAGAKAQESLAWVIQALMKAVTDAQASGQVIPPELMAELQMIASKVTQETAQAANISMPQPPQMPQMPPTSIGSPLWTGGQPQPQGGQVQQ